MCASVVSVNYSGETIERWLAARQTVRRWLVATSRVHGDGQRAASLPHHPSLPSNKPIRSTTVFIMTDETKFLRKSFDVRNIFDVTRNNVRAVEMVPASRYKGLLDANVRRLLPDARGGFNKLRMNGT